MLDNQQRAYAVGRSGHVYCNWTDVFLYPRYSTYQVPGTWTGIKLYHQRDQFTYEYTALLHAHNLLLYQVDGSVSAEAHQ